MKQYYLSPVALYLILATSLLVDSCYPGNTIYDPVIVPDSRQKENVYYVPSAPNTPLLTNKNDFDINVFRTSESKFSGFDIQGAYLPAKHIGIIAGYSIVKNPGGYPDYMKFHRFELGAGYVTQFSKLFHFEAYGGFGSGKITNYHYTGMSKINQTHVFFQPAIAVSNDKKTVQFAFVSRFAGVNFDVKDTLFSNDREPLSTENIKSLYEDPFHIMWEPGFVFRAGWKNFLFHTGYSFSTDLTNRDLYRGKGNFSAGFSVRFNAGETASTRK